MLSRWRWYPPYVQELIDCLNELHINWEIILVGNYLEGADDRTPDIVRNIAAQDQHIKAITKEKEGMMGWDMKRGLEVATGRAIAITDGDGQFPLKDIALVYKKLIDENLDMVKTYRIKRSDGLCRFILSTAYNMIFKIMFPGFTCCDANSKP